MQNSLARALSHPATVILKNEVLINKGVPEAVQVDVPEKNLNFFRNLGLSFPEKEMRNMDKINKYEQNNHNARNANRRERRVKANLRARNGRYPRTIKVPPVQILTISNVPSDVLDAIDELAAGQDRSRSSFVRRELQRIVAGYRAQAA
jgi:hypothetical protein